MVSLIYEVQLACQLFEKVQLTSLEHLDLCSRVVFHNFDFCLNVFKLKVSFTFCFLCQFHQMGARVELPITDHYPITNHFFRFHYRCFILSDLKFLWECYLKS